MKKNPGHLPVWISLDYVQLSGNLIYNWGGMHSNDESMI